MAAVTSSTCALWILILTTSLILTGCMGAFPVANYSRVFTVGAILVKPFVMELDEADLAKDPGYAGYKGFIPDLLYEIGGVDFKIIIQPDGKFGAKQADSQWNGLVGSLSRQEIDMAAGPVTISSMKYRAIEFSQPFMSTGLVLVVSGSLRDGSAAGSMSRLLLVLKPFRTVAWIMLIAGVLMIVVFAAIVHRLNPRDKKTGHTGAVSTLLTTCPGGGPYSGCLLRVTMVNFVLLTLVLYTAGMVSLLMYTTRMENAQTPQGRKYEDVNIADVVESGQYKIAVVRDSETQTFFRESYDPLYKRINEMLTYVENVSAGFDLVLKDPGYAFITDSALVDYYTSRPPYCGMNIVGGSLSDNGYGLAYPLESVLRQRIDEVLLNMRESGRLQIIQRKWWYDWSLCYSRTGPDKKKLTPASPGIDSTTLGGVLIILVIGLLLAVGAGVVERFLLSSKANVREDQGDMT